MAKKKAKTNKRIKTTEWAIGQSLVSPKKKKTKGQSILVIKKDDFQNALDVLEHAIGAPLVRPRRQNRKKTQRS